MYPYDPLYRTGVKLLLSLYNETLLVLITLINFFFKSPQNFITRPSKDLAGILNFSRLKKTFIFSSFSSVVAFRPIPLSRKRAVAQTGSRKFFHISHIFFSHSNSCSHLHTRTWSHTHTHASAHTHGHGRTHTCTCTCSHAHIC